MPIVATDMRAGGDVFDAVDETFDKEKFRSDLNRPESYETYGGFIGS